MTLNVLNVPVEFPVTVPVKVTFPPTVVNVAEANLNPPNESMEPRTVPVLLLNCRRLAVWLELAHWTINPMEEELAVSIWNDDDGWVVLRANLEIDEVAYISVPEMIHLKGSSLPVEVVYLLF